MQEGHGRSWHCHGVHQVTQRQSKSYGAAADVVLDSGKWFSNNTKQRSCGNTKLPSNWGLRHPWPSGTSSPYTTALLCREAERREGKISPKCQLQIPTTSHSSTVTAPSHPAPPYPCRALGPDQTAAQRAATQTVEYIQYKHLVFCRMLKSNPGFSQAVSALLLPFWVRGLWLLSSVC